MSRVDVSHLVGLPYREGGRNPMVGVDCLWCCLAVNEAIAGGRLPRGLYVDPRGDDPAEVLAAYLDAIDGAWAPVPEGEALRLGDVLLWVGPGGAPRPHAAVVVDDGARGEALTSDALHGSSHLLRYRLIRSPATAYRLCPTSRPA